MKRRRDKRFVVLMGCAGALLILCAALVGNAKKPESEVVAHEWGTFTSIAGNAGTAVEWYPWAVPTDLPEFVEHFQSRNFKVNLSGKIRMETPVLYFYSPQETTVSVHVSFADGLITEWYPHVTRFTPSADPSKVRFIQGNEGGSVTWDSVAVRPGDEGPAVQEDKASRYYAARATASTPLRVAAPAGPQYEKFLFYRGVSSADSPVVARTSADGRVLVENVSGEAIAATFLFERRGANAGFRSVPGLTSTEQIEPVTLDSSAAAASEQILAALMNQGLYPDEAQAMVETWKDAWFEEGTRLLYIVPRSFVDRVLPLTITPAPANVTRVFVGRLELVSPRTQTAIETALATGDEPTLAKYNRFLEPILAILAQRETDPVKARLVRERMRRPYAPVVAEDDGN